MSIFSQILNIDLDEIHYVATTCWFVEVMLNLFAQVIFKGEKSADIL